MSSGSAGQIIGIGTSPPSGPGGPEVAGVQDVAGNDHQAVAIEFIPASGADPILVSPAAPLPVAQTGVSQVNVVAGGAAAGTPGTPSADVISIQGDVGMTPVVVSDALSTGSGYSNGSAPVIPAIVPAKTSPGKVSQIIAFNFNATPVYLKFWDTSSAPSLGATAATYYFPIPANTSGSGFVISFRVPRNHANAIYYAVTNGVSLTDNSNIPAANTVFIDVSVTP